MIELFQYEFMRNAIIAAILASVVCGIIGTYIVVKKIVFISGGISHASFGGVGLGYLIGINPLITAIPFAVLSAVSVGIINRKTKINEDAIIGVIWSVGMALGLIFISLKQGYAPDLFSYLFGSILTVTHSDLILMSILDVIIITIVYLFYKEFLSISFDEEFSTVVGVPTNALYLLLLSMVALSIIVLIRVAGIILVLALLTMPILISRQFIHDNLRNLMVSSSIISAILVIIGLLVSYTLDLIPGATIVLILSIAFIFAFLIKKYIPNLS
ncbi:MAG TPA: metal ABC transporter permease [Halobacteria archaeon]|nr:metal ABC transporter permease [Halobacteria archaeon]